MEALVDGVAALLEAEQPDVRVLDGQHVLGAALHDEHVALVQDLAAARGHDALGAAAQAQESLLARAGITVPHRWPHIDAR